MRRPPTPVVDTAIAVGVFAGSALPILLSGDGRWWHVLVAAAGSAPLVLRRRAPLLTTLIVGVATSVLGLVHQLPPLPFGALVATYTFALFSPSPWRQVAITVQAVAVVASLLVPGEDPAVFGYVGMAYVAAYSLGIGARGRRDRIAMLEERAAREAEERAAAAVRERNRIAREVHDIVAHTVAVMVVQAEAGPVVCRDDPDRAERTFEVIAESGRAAIEQLRRSLAALRAPDEPPESAHGAADLEELVAAARRGGLTVTLRGHGSRRPLPPEVDATVYRVAQEALTNAVRHAGAASAAVRLDYTTTGVRVTITDDGRGHPDPVPGNGLTGMRERVTACGGELRIGPGPDGAGFAVEAVLPAAPGLPR